jgi:NTE family protein
MTTAFVLSGGGNYGALQAGALEVLYENKIQPDVLVGVSAGSLNAAWMVQHSSLSGAQQLSRLWVQHVPRYMPPLHYPAGFLRLLRRQKSLLPNEGLEQFLRTFIPAEQNISSFTRPHLYVLATRSKDGTPRVFGDKPEDLLLDGLMSSSALPPFLPPWRVDGETYIDGAAISNLPLQIAIERGVDGNPIDDIYALNIGGAQPEKTRLKSSQAYTAFLRYPSNISSRILNLALGIKTRIDIHSAQVSNGKSRLHLIHLWSDKAPSFWDFSHGEELIESGRRAVENYLRDFEV